MGDYTCGYVGHGGLYRRRLPPVASVSIPPLPVSKVQAVCGHMGCSEQVFCASAGIVSTGWVLPSQAV